MKLGITNAVRSQAEVPILPDVNHPYPKMILKSVSVESLKTSNRGDLNVLSFKFVDTTGKKHFNHVEWPVAYGAKKEEDAVQRLMSRVKHIYETYNAFPEAGIGNVEPEKDADGNVVEVEVENEEMQQVVFTKFFEKIAQDFNAVKESWVNTQVYGLITYNGTSAGFPLLPNFIEKVVNGAKPETLVINPKYHILTPQAKAANVVEPGGNGGAPSMNEIP
jgi:hypothetical protein